MDGFEENDKIIVIAATNMINNIDAALQRPNRFDKKIEIKLPNSDERRAILDIHLRSKPNKLGPSDMFEAA